MSTIRRHTISSFKKAFSVEDAHSNYFFKEFNEDSNYPEEPYRTETYGIGFVKKGRLFLTSGLSDFDIQSPALLTMGPNVIRKWTNTYSSSRVETIFFTRDFFSSVFANSQLLSKFAFFEASDLSVHRISDKAFSTFENVFEQLKIYLDGTHQNEDALIRHQIASLCFLIDELNQTTMSHEAFGLSHQFKQEAATHIKQHRDVGFYADRLNTTPKYLSGIVKKELGRTASQVLHNLAILEAKILLQNPELTASEVAYELHFPDPSTFGKYFKKYAGLSPAAYQKEILTS